MCAKVSKKYGLPFRGYMSSKPDHNCPNDYATLGSHDYLFSPVEGCFVRRKSHLDIAGSKESSLWVGKDRQLVEFTSPSSGVSSPSTSVLYTRDSVTFGALNSSRFGQMVFDSNKVCGLHSTDNYPSNTNQHFKCVPLWYDSGEGGVTRLNSDLTRRFHCPGSRRVIDNGDWRYFPSYYGTPSKWNRRHNSATGTEEELYYLSGPVPPLWAPYPLETTVGSAKNWKAGQTFYVSIMFQMDDGTWSMPVVPRPVNNNLPSGVGLCTVPGAIDTYVENIKWEIPIGPPGTVKRAFLRTDSTNTLDAVSILPAYDKLKISAIIPDNTSREYVDSMGDDVGLVDDPDKLYVRWDHIMPPASRYLWEFDGRTAAAYGRTSRCAIFLAPVGSVAMHDRNLTEDDALLYNQASFFVRVANGGEITLTRRTSSAAYVSSIIDSAGQTLQNVCDTINASTIGGTGAGQWRAQIAPGASPQALAINFLPTCYSSVSGSCTGSSGVSSITVPSTIGSRVAVGMKIAGTGIATGTHVGAVNSTGTVVYLCTEAGVSTNTSSALSGVHNFYNDFGDDGVANNTLYGNQRVISGSYYGCLYFKNSFFSKTPSDESSVWMTVGGPLQTHQSANGFVSAPGNKHTPAGDPGICMGGGGLADGSVVLFANERYVLRNNKSGRSGLDEDYRMDRVSRTGCVCDTGIVIGNGWVGFPSIDGYIAGDMSGELNLTRDVWDSGSKVGSLGYELGQCSGSSVKDGDTGLFYAAITGNKLNLCYRSASSATYPDNRLVMDFGGAAANSGLNQLISPDGRPWGWSTPFLETWSSIGSIRLSTGLASYAVIQPGNTIAQIDSQTSSIECMLVCATDFFDTFESKAADYTTIKYRGSALFTFLRSNYGLSRDGTAAGGVQSANHQLSNVAGDQYKLKKIQWDQTMRRPSESMFLTIYQGTAGAVSYIYGAETVVDVLDVY
jgi:hypothetical protein